MAMPLMVSWIGVVDPRQRALRACVVVRRAMRRKASATMTMTGAMTSARSASVGIDDEQDDGNQHDQQRTGSAGSAPA